VVNENMAGAARVHVAERGRDPRDYALLPPPAPAWSSRARSATTRPARSLDQGHAPAYFPEAGGFVPTTVYDRYRLRAGDELTGPAVVEEEGSTLVVGPGGQARVEATGNIVLTLPT
jgi:N-methylhydantoinase A